MLFFVLIFFLVQYDGTTTKDGNLDSKDVQSMIDVLKKEDISAKLNTLNLIMESNIKTQEVLSQLLALLKDSNEDENIRWKAASAFEKFKIKETEKLEKLLCDADQTVRWLALKALGKLNDEKIGFDPSAQDNYGKNLNDMM